MARTVVVAAVVAGAAAAGTTHLVPDLPRWALAAVAVAVVVAVAAASVAARGLATSPLAVALAWVMVGAAPWDGWPELAARGVLAAAVAAMVLALYGTGDPDVVVAEVVDDDASPT